MTKWLQIILQSLISSTRSRRDLAFENLLLRQQLAAMKHCQPRAKLSNADRIFRVLFSKFWPNWRDALHIVTPETVVRWHRQGFRYYWTWKSRRSGRPKVDPTIRDLICRMCRANRLWGAPSKADRSQLCQLLQQCPNASVFGEVRSRQATCSSPKARKNSLTTVLPRTPS